MHDARVPRYKMGAQMYAQWERVYAQRAHASLHDGRMRQCKMGAPVYQQSTHASRHASRHNGRMRLSTRFCAMEASTCVSMHDARVSTYYERARLSIPRSAARSSRSALYFLRF